MEVHTVQVLAVASFLVVWLASLAHAQRARRRAQQERVARPERTRRARKGESRPTSTTTVSRWSEVTGWYEQDD